MTPTSEHFVATSHTRAVGGTVYLVGGGPGDPALLTVRAQQLIMSADVVVYDSLAPAIEKLAVRDGVECINAGKRANDHTLSQDEINAVIVERASAGLAVVRLKGGDPLVFGRGGEEARACRAADIPFEIVPGVTSALAATAYAGIPVTYRGVSESVTFVTAQRGAVGAEIDYPWLAKCAGTLVVFMGLRAVGAVADNLVAHGKPAGTPTAVISNGTTAYQRTVVGTLETIEADVAAAALSSPALIVIGEVVQERASLAWYEDLPLLGTRVVVTRAQADASQLATRLSRLGADVIEAPSIVTKTVDTAPLDAALATMDQYDAVVTTSRHAVRQVWLALERCKLDARHFAGVTIIAVGESTADEWRHRGIEPDVVPPFGERFGAALTAHLAQTRSTFRNVLFPRAIVAREETVTELRGLCEKVHVVHVYETHAEDLTEDVLVAAQEADLVTFGSAQTVINFVDAVGCVPDIPCVAIGPTAAAAAERHGFVVAGVAQDPSIDGLVRAVLDAVTENRSENLAVAASNRV